MKWIKPTGLGVSLVLLLTACGAKIEPHTYRFSGRFDQTSSIDNQLSNQSDRHRLAYLEREGVTEETIVFIHDFGWDKEVWRELIEELPKRYRVMAIDLPGHGVSSRTLEINYSVETYVYTVGQFLGEKAPREFHLVGSGLGGQVASLYAIDNPKKVISLSMISPVGLRGRQLSLFDQLLDEGVNPLIVKSKKDYRRWSELMFEDPPSRFWPGQKKKIRALVSNRLLRKKIWEDLSQSDIKLSDHLPELTTPTLLLWGREDRVSDQSSAAEWRQYIKSADQATIKKVGHLPMLEDDSETAEQLVEFISGVSQLINDQPFQEMLPLVADRISRDSDQDVKFLFYRIYDGPKPFFFGSFSSGEVVKLAPYIYRALETELPLAIGSADPQLTFEVVEKMIYYFAEDDLTGLTLVYLGEREDERKLRNQLAEIGVTVKFQSYPLD